MSECSGLSGAQLPLVSEWQDCRRFLPFRDFETDRVVVFVSPWVQRKRVLKNGRLRWVYRERQPTYAEQNEWSASAMDDVV